MSYRPSYPRNARPPVSQRTYLLRRVGAIGLLVVGVLAAVTVFQAAFGGSEPSRANAVPPATSLVVSAGGSTITAGPTTSTTSPPKERTTPTPDNKALLLIAGDSDAGTFGPYLETLLDQTGLVETHLDYKVSSGLSRPDFYDWPAHFNEILPQVNPDIVVVTFGGNDAQGLSVADGTFIHNQPNGDAEHDAAWREEYGRRVGVTMDQLLAGGRTIVWVGIPNDDNPEVTARMQVQDEVVKAEAAKRPKVIMIDTWARFSGRNGGWAEFVIDPRDGIGKDVRGDDGFHLNVAGAEILALDIAEAVRQELRDRGATL